MTHDTDRLTGFDLVRAAAMLLGIVLHAAMSYINAQVDRVWPMQDPGSSVFFDLIVAGIHSFRMPLFFLLSGFFFSVVLTTTQPAAGCA
jgi:surface polysaccharide O-acyltransferase-like enzyme